MKKAILLTVVTGLFISAGAYAFSIGNSADANVAGRGVFNAGNRHNHKQLKHKLHTSHDGRSIRYRHLFGRADGDWERHCADNGLCSGRAAAR